MTHPKATKARKPPREWVVVVNPRLNNLAQSIYSPHDPDIRIVARLHDLEVVVVREVVLPKPKKAKVSGEDKWYSEVTYLRAEVEALRKRCAELESAVKKNEEETQADGVELEIVVLNEERARIRDGLEKLLNTAWGQQHGDDYREGWTHAVEGALALVKP